MPSISVPDLLYSLFPSARIYTTHPLRGVIRRFFCNITLYLSLPSAASKTKVPVCLQASLHTRGLPNHYSLSQVICSRLPAMSFVGNVAPYLSLPSAASKTKVPVCLQASLHTRGLPNHYSLSQVICSRLPAMSFVGKEPTYATGCLRLPVKKRKGPAVANKFARRVLSFFFDAFASIA